MIAVSYSRSRALAGALLFLALVACHTAPVEHVEPPQPPLTLPPNAFGAAGAVHLLDRLAFGPTPGQVEEVLKLGADHWIAQQMTPARIPESPELIAALAKYPELNETPANLHLAFQDLRKPKPDAESQKAANEFANHVVADDRAAYLIHAVESRRQFQAVLTEFWFNHFNIFVGKGQDRLWTGSFVREAIRPHVFGRFRDLLEATARHPAMLFYLDNWQNTAPGSPGARGREEGLNENYAREVMELHTLGVDGGYSQNDVTALARILTGWGLRQKGDRRHPADYSFVFDPARHDFSDKLFLNYQIRGQGPAEVEIALSILAASPKTAYHLCRQLAQFFVTDDPDPALVDAMARAYLASGTNLTAVYRAMIEHPAFWAPNARRAKFKTPVEYVVSSLRAAGLSVTTPRPLIGAVAQMGQPIFGVETPDGNKWTQSAWMSEDGLARRLNFATFLASGRMPLNGPPPQNAVPLDDKMILAALGNEISPRTSAAIAGAHGGMRAALLLGSPDFMHR